MKLSLQEIEALGESARISFRTKAEKERFQNEISEMLESVWSLRDADMPEVLSIPSARESIWREDTVGESLPQQDVLKNAPLTEGEYFAVPAALENRIC